MRKARHTPGLLFMMGNKVEVWDLQTRVFHWALVVCVTGSYVSVEIFEDLV